MLINSVCVDLGQPTGGHPPADSRKTEEEEEAPFCSTDFSRLRSRKVRMVSLCVRPSCTNQAQKEYTEPEMQFVHSVGNSDRNKKRICLSSNPEFEVGSITLCTAGNLTKCTELTKNRANI